MPSWCKAAIDAWDFAAGNPTSGGVFLAINKGGKLAGQRVTTKEGKRSNGYITPQAVANLISVYGPGCGVDNLAAHDLRRTFAKLAHKGGACKLLAVFVECGDLLGIGGFAFWVVDMSRCGGGADWMIPEPKGKASLQGLIDV